MKKRICAIIILLNQILQIMSLVPIKLSNKSITSIAYIRTDTNKSEPTLTFYILPSKSGLMLDVRCGSLSFFNISQNYPNCLVYKLSDRKFRNDQLNCRIVSLEKESEFNISKSDVNILEAPQFLRVNSFNCSSLGLEYHLWNLIKCSADDIIYEFQYKDREEENWKNQTGKFDKNFSQQTIVFGGFEKFCHSKNIITRLRYQFQSIWSDYMLLNLSIQTKFHDHIQEKLLTIEGKTEFYHSTCDFKKCEEDLRKTVKSQLNCTGPVNDFDCHYKNSNDNTGLKCQNLQKNATNIFKSNFENIKNIECTYFSQENDSINQNTIDMNLYELISNVEIHKTNSCKYGVLKWHTKNKIDKPLDIESVSVQLRQMDDSFLDLAIQNIKFASNELEIHFHYDNYFEDKKTYILNLRFKNESEYLIYEHNCPRNGYPEKFIIFLVLFVSLFILGIAILYVKKIKKGLDIKIELPKSLQPLEPVTDSIMYDFISNVYTEIGNEPGIMKRPLPQTPPEQPHEDYIDSDNYIRRCPIDNLAVASTNDLRTNGNLNQQIKSNYVPML